MFFHHWYHDYLIEAIQDQLLNNGMVIFAVLEVFGLHSGPKLGKGEENYPTSSGTMILEEKNMRLLCHIFPE